MKKPTIKVKILKTLLESPKNTGNIAIALGYKGDKYGKYNNVQPDLKTLEQYKIIHTIKSKKTVGAPGTTYDINYDFFASGYHSSDLRDFLEKYPSLIPDLQNNDIIRDILLDQHPELCLREFPPEAYEMAREGEKKIPGVEETFKMMVEGTIEPGKEEFKNFLKKSPAFFKICLLNDTEYIKKRVSYMYKGFAAEYVFDKERLKSIYINETPQLRARNILYKFCVIQEAL